MDSIKWSGRRTEETKLPSGSRVKGGFCDINISKSLSFLLALKWRDERTRVGVEDEEEEEERGVDERGRVEEEGSGVVDISGW